MINKDLNFAGEAVFEAINNQIRNNDPPETKHTYDRLTSMDDISMVNTNFSGIYTIFLQKKFSIERSGNLQGPWQRIFTSAIKNMKILLIHWNPILKKEKGG